jgi:hypothetical protein
VYSSLWHQSPDSLLNRTLLPPSESTLPSNWVLIVCAQ